MNEKAVRDLAGKYESFYLYEEDVICDRMTKLKEHFEGIEFLYSLKCNPFEPVAKLILNSGFGADAASLSEVLLAKRCGLPADQIYYSAPGKSREDIAGAFGQSVIIADSLTEVERIREEAEKRETSVSIGLRINPAFSFTDDQLHGGKFGVDQPEALEFLKHAEDSTLRISGIHVHVKSQELDAEKLSRYYDRMFRLAGEAEEALGHPLDFINMGSGIGIPYGPEDAPVDLETLGSVTENMLASYRKGHPSTKVIIESGRFLVCESGTYVTHVADRKVSGGKTYVILHNTMNGFLRPSLAQLVVKYAGGNPAGTEPLFTKADAFPIRVLTNSSQTENPADRQPAGGSAADSMEGSAAGCTESSEETETVTLCGDLCTSADVIAENTTLPVTDEGDIVCIGNAGSYAAVLSPMQFSSKKKPAQILLTAEGSMTEEE